MRGLPNNLSLFPMSLQKSINTSTNVRFYLSYDIKVTLKLHLGVKKLRFCHDCVRNVLNPLLHRLF